jgi:hypothetical protein
VSIPPKVVPVWRLREVLASATSLKAASLELGVAQPTLRALALREGLRREWNACKRNGLRHTGISHAGQYNFVDMAGQTIAGVEVIDRVANLTGNANWKCKHPCGHVAQHEGIRLRAQEKRGLVMRCWECEPKGGGRRPARYVPPLPEPLSRVCDECHEPKEIAAFDDAAPTCMQCETELATPARVMGGDRV